MITKLFSALTTISLIIAGVVTRTSFVNAATIGSSINFSGYVFGSSEQLDYIDSSAFPVSPNPNMDGSFQVLNATGSFAAALTNPPQFGTIRDLREGSSPGIIMQASPLFNSSDNPDFYVPNFLQLNVPELVNFKFQLETVNRTVAIAPDSNPYDPFILGISASLTGTLTDLETNEVQPAVGSIIPNIPPNTKLSQFTPNDFLGPATYTGSLQVVPEPTTNAGLALFGVFFLSYAANKRKKLTQVKLPVSKS